MCGRFTIRKPVTKTVDIVKTKIKVEDSDNYNAHPTQQLPIIKSYTNGKALELCEWGLVPAWSKKLDKFSPLINARKETLMEKVTFKNLIQTSRCIVPADGYYEWKREDKTKTPYYFTPKRMFQFAETAEKNGFGVIIAGAGGAAHLAGMIASLTTLPVLGVPMETKKLKGLDSLLSMAQMPKGVPIGCLAIDGAFNAGLLAASIIGNFDHKVKSNLEKWRRLQTQSIKKKPK